jgi:hypothetical protein
MIQAGRISDLKDWTGSPDSPQSSELTRDQTDNGWGEVAARLDQRSTSLAYGGHFAGPPDPNARLNTKQMSFFVSRNSLLGLNVRNALLIV